MDFAGFCQLCDYPKRISGIPVVTIEDVVKLRDETDDIDELIRKIVEAEWSGSS